MAANANEPAAGGAFPSGETAPLDVLDDLASGGDGTGGGTGGPEYPVGGGDGYQDAGPVFMPRDQWMQLFGGVLGMTGQVAGLDTLANSPRAPGFGPAAGELYDLCCQNDSMHWLVAVDNPTLKSVVVVGAWAVPVALGCAHEIRAKRARPVAPVDAEAAREAPATATTGPANDNQGE